MKKLLWLCAALPMWAQSLEPWIWKNVNIQGMGYVTGLVAQSSDPFDVYIRTDVGGVYRYDRQAARWLPLTDAFASTPGTGTESVAIDPSMPLRVYVVLNRPVSSKGGKYSFAAEVMVSEDRGTTWRATNLGARNLYQGANDDYRVESGERLAVDPVNPAVLYFASRRNGLWQGLRQPDGHYVWSSVQGGLPAWKDDPAGYTFVVFDSSSAASGTTQTIYAGVHGSGVWRTTDAGATWSNLGGGDNPCRAALASDGTLYVSFGTLSPASGAVRRYRAGAWADITPSDKSSAYTGISVDPEDANTVMVGRDRNVYRSLDAGATWSSQRMTMHKLDPHDFGSNPSAPGYYLSNTAGASSGMAAMIIDPIDHHQVWWTNGWGVARTDDVFAPTPFWAWRMENLEELVAVGVAVPPKPKPEGGADLITMAMDMIGFRHADRDQVPDSKISPAGVPINPSPTVSWQRSAYGPTFPVPWPHTTMGSSVDYTYRSPDNLAFVGQAQWQNWPVYGSSNDNGRTWTAFPTLPVEKLWSGGKQQDSTPIGGQIAMSSTNPGSMIWAPTWGTYDGSSASAAASPWPQYTLDGGKTWNVAKLADPPAPPAPFNPQNNDHNHFDALPRSWANSVHPYVSTNILSADRADPSGKTFFYFDGTSFYSSQDSGATWKRSAAKGFPSYIVRVTIASNPTVPGDVWLAFARNGEDVDGNPLFHSTDGGQTFSKVAGVDVCDRIAIGRGTGDDSVFLYIVGRVNGSSRDAIYKSEDMAANWIRISNPDIQAMTDLSSMAADMRTPNLLYLAMNGRGVIYGVPAAETPHPVIDTDGVRNAASSLPQVARGSLVRLRGIDLSSGTVQSAILPLPRRLLSTLITVNDEPAPLVAVAPDEITFQLPWDLPLEGTVIVRVVNGAAYSDTLGVDLLPAAPGLFPRDVRHMDGNIVTEDAPATAGEELVIRATGFGDWPVLPESGFGSPAGVTLRDLPTATLGEAAATVTSVTLAKEVVGLADVRVKLPDPLPDGDTLPLVVTVAGTASNAISIALRR